MPKLKQQDLNRMIENAVSYNQESVTDDSSSFIARCKNLFSRPKAYFLTAASFIVLLTVISPISSSRSMADVNQIYDFITLEIIEDL
tara:strand:- start:684 stop:944 length:261 start_codon:yes stop_codon:yes gene_type:complete